jgi:hypothetical protein
LRGLGEDAEPFVRGAAALTPDDALGLFDHGAVFHRGLQVLGEGGGGVVKVCVGKGHGRVAGEGPPDEDASSSKASGLRA